MFFSYCSNVNNLIISVSLITRSFSMEPKGTIIMCRPAYDSCQQADLTTCTGIHRVQTPIFSPHASLSGYGALLGQKHNGKERVKAFASHSLKPSENTCPAQKLEFLALKWVISEKLRNYLCDSKLVLLTDNNLLTCFHYSKTRCNRLKLGTTSL